MSIAIKRLERAIGDLPKGGMQTGAHKVKLDLSDAERLIVELNALQAEIDSLRNVCAQAYQMAGAIDAPVEALDNLSAAANGDPIPHETFLPIFGDHLAAHDAEVAKKAVQSALRMYGNTDLNNKEIIALSESYAASLKK